MNDDTRDPGNTARGAHDTQQDQEHNMESEGQPVVSRQGTLRFPTVATRAADEAGARAGHEHTPETHLPRVALLARRRPV